MIVANGSTDVTTYFVLRDSTNHAPITTPLTGTDQAADTATDIDLYYVEQLAAISSKADAVSLGSANAAHADNKVYHVGQGLYRIDWPDAAFDGGVGKKVILIVVCSGVDTTFLEVELSPPANITEIGGTAVTASSGIPEVKLANVSHGGSSTNLTLKSLLLRRSDSGTTVEIDNSSTGKALYVHANGAVPLTVAADSGNFDAVSIAGSGSGEGVKVTAGASGNAVELIGGATIGNALLLTTTNGSAFKLSGAGSGAFGIEVAAGGVKFTNASGNGMLLESTGGNGHGLSCVKHGTGKDIDADEIDAIPTVEENADGLLGRNVAGGSSSGRLVKEAFYLLRNKWVVDSGILTVYGTDDVTPAFTASVSSDANADPIVGNDPA